MAENNHPDYYNKGGIEVWDIFRAYGLSVPRAFAVKYILRAGQKDKHKEIEDINKAINCLEREKQEITQRYQQEVKEELKQEVAFTHSMMFPKKTIDWCNAIGTPCSRCVPGPCESRGVRG